MGNQPLCMRQFYNILSACRVPGVKKDSIVTFPPNEPNAPKHITVIHNNHVSGNIRFQHYRTGFLQTYPSLRGFAPNTSPQPEFKINVHGG